MVLAAAGVASLLRAYPQLFFALKWAGAAYLAWLGASMLRSAWQDWRRDPAAAPVVAVVSTRDPFRRAVMVSLLNPKAILFFLSVFILFVDRRSPSPALLFLVLVLIPDIPIFTETETA